MNYGYLEYDCINSFHNMIEKYLRLNNNLYSKNISISISDILLVDDEYNKQLFFDNFKSIECNDKEKIVGICSFDVVSKTNLIINNSSEAKINEIIKFVEELINKQKNIEYESDKEKEEKVFDYINNLITNISNFLLYKKDSLNIELKSKINNLNKYERLTFYSIILNIFNIKYDEIKKISNEQFVNIPDFIKLLSFYIPIHTAIYYLKENEYVADEKNYVKIDSINQRLKLLLNKQNKNAMKVLSKKEVIYYLIYQFLINLDIDETSKNYINEIMLILNNKLKIDNDIIEYLFKYYENCNDIRSIEEQITNIKALRNNNLSPIMNLFATFDIADYKKLEKKKKDFGLK